MYYVCYAKTFRKERALTCKIDEFVKRMNKGGWEEKKYQKQLGIQLVQEGLKEFAGEAVVQHIQPSWLANIKTVSICY